MAGAGQQAVVAGSMCGAAWADGVAPAPAGPSPAPLCATTRTQMASWGGAWSGRGQVGEGPTGCQAAPHAPMRELHHLHNMQLPPPRLLLRANP